MKAERICFESKGKAILKTVELPPLEEGQALVENDYSIVSAGTELANFKGMPNTNSAKTGFPWFPGYSAAGRVIETAGNVQHLKAGDRVVVQWGGHSSHNICAGDSLVKIEDDRTDQLEAAFAHIASFPMLAIRKLEIKLGESVMIAGQGLLGLIAVQLANLTGGIPVLSSDLDPARRELSEKLGATASISPADANYVEKVRSFTDCGINAAVEVTGVAAALQQALEYAAFEGRIALLGCTRIPDVQIDFYKYVHSRGVKLIGANTWARPRLESRPNEWTEMDDYRAFLKFLAAGKIRTRPLISEIASPGNAPEIYARMAEMKNPPLGLAFDWSRIK